MKSTLLKLLAMALVVCMLIPAFAACGGGNGNETETETQPAETDPAETTGGTEPEESETEEVIEYEDHKAGKYSYRMAPSELPNAWNLHTYQNNTSTYILDYSSDTLYTFDYADEKCEKFAIVPSMAAEEPVDVTSEYVGKYGIVEGDENKAWEIKLKTNLKFDNGATLNANSFVDSMKLLLNPAAANFRADNVYGTSNLKIYGAENYVKQGTTTIQDCTEGQGIGQGIYTGWSVGNETTPGMTGAEIDAEIAGSIFFDLVNCYVNQGWAGGETAEEVAAVFNSYAGVPVDTLLAMNGKTLAEIREDTDMMEALQCLLYDFWCTDDDEPWGFFCYNVTWEDNYDFANVGFFAKDDNTLVVVSKSPMVKDFFLMYELCTNFFLVYAPLYEECISMEGGVYANTYGTSLDTYVGYGPYKLTKFVNDAKIVLEKNDYWHGYAPEEYKEGTYQTNQVVFYKVVSNATRLEMFLKGEIDSYGLQAEDMKDYVSSPYIYFDDSESTWYMAMNPDYDNLVALQEKADPQTPGNIVNKTVLSITEFRQALSYAIDRTEYNQVTSPTSGVAKALLSAMIIADPENGISYRSMDAAKDAILEFWGLADAWGEGEDKEYETRDEAIETITGYDPEGAKVLFTTAYNQAVADELIPADAIASGNWEVQIVIGMPSQGNYYTKGYEFFSTCWVNAVVGTPFEGHLVVKPSETLGNSFGEKLRSGAVDVLFGVGFGGSMFDPYSTIGTCYVGSLQYDPFTDKTKIMLDITFDESDELLGGKTLRASLYDWAGVSLIGEEVVASVIENGVATGETITLTAGTNDPSMRRIAILAACETKILTLSNVFPLQTDASASLRCQRIQYKTEEYVLGMGRGGLQYNTYTMDDAEFAAFVAQNGGALNYK